MPTRLVAWLSASLGHVPGAATLLLLAALLAWGHSQGWTLPEIDARRDKAEGALTRVVPDPDVADSESSGFSPHNRVRIEFPSEEAVANTGLATDRATVHPLAEQVAAPAVLTFNQARFVQLASRASGAVWAVPKRAGDRVQPGEVLALVDSLEVGKAKADLLRSLVQYDLKRLVREQMRSGEGSVPDRLLREAEAAYREARVGLLHDLQALANLGLPVRLEDFAGQSDEQVFNRLRVLGLPPLHQREVDRARGSAGLLPIVAPFAGEVIRCTAVRGEVVGPAQPLFTLAATDPMWATLELRPEDVGKLRVGQAVAFKSDDASLESATGTLAWISAEADPKTRTVRARATLPNPLGRLRANIFGTGRVLVRENPGAVTVPEKAVQQDGKVNLVFVRLAPTVFQARQVELGIRDGDRVEVRSGVRAGEVVIVAGSHVLKSELRKDLIAAPD